MVPGASLPKHRNQPGLLHVAGAVRLVFPLSHKPGLVHVSPVVALLVDILFQKASRPAGLLHVARAVGVICTLAQQASSPGCSCAAGVATSTIVFLPLFFFFNIKSQEVVLQKIPTLC